MTKKCITYVSEPDSHSVFREDQDIRCFRCLDWVLIMPFMESDID